MKIRYATFTLALSAAVMPISVVAAETGHDAHHAAPATDSAAPLSAGEVRKVDPDAKKITIRHGPLDNLGMPPMTMVFRVSDPTLLAQVKAGDRIRFRAENQGGAFVVTRIEMQ